MPSMWEAIMAGFCKQCSLEYFDEDFRDLAGLGNGKKLKEGYGWSVLCEGCGPTTVDDDGVCTYTHCPKHGKQNG